MIRFSSQRRQRGAQARVLVLLAALLLAGAPLLEAGHSHSAAEAYTSCLLCKKSSDTAVVASVPALQLLAEWPQVTVTAPIAPRLAPSYTPEIRGPPVYA